MIAVCADIPGGGGSGAGASNGSLKTGAEKPASIIIKMVTIVFFIILSIKKSPSALFFVSA
jgi:hypothetical protein